MIEEYVFINVPLMLYYLFDYLDKAWDVPGAGVFRYISFRASMAIIFSLLFSFLVGKKIIAVLHRKQVGETIRELGLEGQLQKQGTPTMGGLIIIAAILIPTLLFARLENVYIILMIITTVWLGFIGFVDDYIKVFKKDKQGLRAKTKITRQVNLGLIVGGILYFSPNVVVKEKIVQQNIQLQSQSTLVDDLQKFDNVLFTGKKVKSTKTTIPFFKNNELDYAKLLAFLGSNYRKWAFLVFIPIVILIIAAVSNGANMTDGIDGLATGICAIIGMTLALFAYVSGNTVFANFLNIMYIPNTGELVIFISAFVGACVGFLWFNSYPAEVFMCDTGSLTLGGIIAVIAIAIRKELLLPLLCGVFLLENLSVMLQGSYFKYTRRKYV